MGTSLMTEKLPPVVYGDPAIDRLNAHLWSLPVPENSAAIQRMQREVIELERKAAYCRPREAKGKILCRPVGQHYTGLNIANASVN
jgi:hypothetical protein